MRCVRGKWGKLSADNFPYIGKAIAYLITCQNAPKKLILESMAKKSSPGTTLAGQTQIPL